MADDTALQAIQDQIAQLQEQVTSLVQAASGKVDLIVQNATDTTTARDQAVPAATTATSARDQVVSLAQQVNTQAADVQQKYPNIVAASNTAAAAANIASAASLAALAAGKVFDSANAAATSSNPVINVGDTAWIRPNVTDGLTRIVATKRISTGTTIAAFQIDLSFIGSAEFDDAFPSLAADPEIYGYVELEVDSAGLVICARADTELTLREYIPRALWVSPSQPDAVTTSALTVNGNASITGTLTHASLTIYGQAVDPEIIGYSSIEIDSDGLIVAAVLDDGTSFTYTVPKPTAGVSTNEIAVSSRWVAYLQEDVNDSGLAAIITSDQQTGFVRKILAPGQNSRLRITSDDKYATFMQRSDGILVPRYTRLDGAGSVRPVRPIASGVMWGDSLTASYDGGNPGGALNYMVAAQLGISIANRGWGGQGSAQIAARMGAVDVAFNITGGVLPATGGVGVTAVTPNMFYSPATAPASTMDGTLHIAGKDIRATLSTVSGGTYTLTRLDTGGSTINAASATWTPDGEMQDRVTFIYVGTNDNTLAGVQASIQAMVARLDALDKRYLIFGLHTNELGPIGSADYTLKVEQINTWLYSTYGDHCVRIREGLIAQSSPSDVDYAAVQSQGFVPVKFRNAVNDIHWNQSGRDAIALLVKAQADKIGLLKQISIAA